jgi:CspA family cold shock protein
MEQGQKLQGTVKWFSIRKGYGFITTTDGIDYFVYFEDVMSQDSYKFLDAGDKVEFSVGKARDGRTKAVDVVKIPLKPIPPEIVQKVYDSFLTTDRGE